jgi:WD40 repeat protein
MAENATTQQRDFKREQAVFLAALEATDRNAVLESMCADDPTLRQRIEALLAAHDATGPLPTATLMPPPPDSLTGVVIAGRYKLLEEIGVGGMGQVWMAEQRSPVRRLVALKLIKSGMDSRSVITRFEAERQALALMDHPNIARVFDGGVTDQGRPYFVMELVRGLPVTQYCDQRRMTVRDRLMLFMQICQAVQHAHQKGIIHRDIKPSNVLVTEHDGKPVPKVIDFGLAKALGGTGLLTEHTLHTAFGAMAGTPLYTAPEQVAINSLDIDTRADIYALGVLLYELLTGTTPLESSRLREAAWDEVCRVIREEEPLRPSLRISSSATLSNLAASRQIDAARLSGLVRGDLDWIVLKALEKERNRRYDTATALAADVERHLNDEPVVAAPPAMAYLARKFVRKHRGPVVAGAAVATLLAMGLTTTSWQWRRADLNAKRAAENERAAEAQKSEAEKQRDAAELEAYVANIALGLTAIENDNFAEATRRLSACPVAKRGFEWNFLFEQASRVKAVVPDGGILSPDGRLWLAQVGSVAQLWDLAGNKVGGDMEIGGSGGDSTLFSFGGGGRLVITVLNKTAQLWNLTGQHIGGPFNSYFDCSPDGRLLLTCPDGHTVQLRDLSGHFTCELMRQSGKVVSAVFSPDGKLVLTGSDDGAVRLWDLDGRPVGEQATFPGLESVDFGSDGRLLCVSAGGNTQVWSAHSFKTYESPEEYKAFNDSAGFSPDGRLRLSLVEDNRAVQLLDCNGNPVGRRMENDDAIVRATFSPDGKLVLTACNDGIVRLWDINGRLVGAPMLSYTTAPKAVSPYEDLTVASFASTGGRVLSDDASGLFAWDLRGRLLREADDVYDYTLDPDGDTVILNPNDYYATLRSPELVVRIDHIDSPIENLKFDASLIEEEIAALDAAANRPSAAARASLPARSITRSGTDGTVEVRSPGSETIVLRHDQPVIAAALSPDGTRAVTCTDKLIRFWDAASGRELADISAGQAVHGLAFSHDGRELILSMEDGSTRIWNTRTPEERQRDRDACSSESGAAREYVDKLLATTVPTKELKDIVRKDASLNPIRKVQALRWLAARLIEIDDRAASLFGQFRDVDPRVKRSRERCLAAASAADSFLRVMRASNSGQAIEADSLYGLSHVAGAYFNAGRYADAIAVGRKLIAPGTEFDAGREARALCWIAMSEFKLGHLDAARAALMSASDARKGVDDKELSDWLASARGLIDPSAGATSGPASGSGGPSKAGLSP